MIYKNKFDLRGTTEQVNIIKTGLDKIMFPWDKLNAPSGIFAIGWDDLNSPTFFKAKWKSAPKLHAGPHAPGDDSPQLIEGEVNGRKYILGVFYPGSGNIYVDTALTKYPEVAQATVSAELAHLVDYFLPLTDEQRKAIHGLMHPGGVIPTGEAFWWEKVSYETEYYNLAGEAFMQAFTFAYSDMDFDNSGFSHGITKAQAPEVRKIIGIERTDLAPAQAVTTYKRIGTSKTYHRLTHYENKPGKLITDATGLYPCKTCKP